MSTRIRALAAAAVTVIAVSWTGLAAGSASASAPAIAKVSNGPAGPGEAGYYVNDNGQTRIRDVQATTVVTGTMENLNGLSDAPGGLGVELCNDNTGVAAQLGIEWTGAKFVVEYNYTGNPGFGGAGDVLAASPAQPDLDPCVEGGLLNGGTGQHFGNEITPKTGDTVHFEIYYDPHGHWAQSSAEPFTWTWVHQVKFLVSDPTQGLTRVQTVEIPSVNFYEAGIGVISQQTGLAGGAINLIGTFTGAYFNWYGNCYGAACAPHGIVQPSHWDLELADFINGSNQVTLTPSQLSAGNTTFSELEGSTSP